eukprot:m.81524 g.81524  ORF g.81524 m.81524 type:complete len:1182 (+) comp12640_c0_seq2:418-3963(+)
MMPHRLSHANAACSCSMCVPCDGVDKQSTMSTMAPSYASHTQYTLPNVYPSVPFYGYAPLTMVGGLPQVMGMPYPNGVANALAPPMQTNYIMAAQLQQQQYCFVQQQQEQQHLLQQQHVSVLQQQHLHQQQRLLYGSTRPVTSLQQAVVAEKPSTRRSEKTQSAKAIIADDPADTTLSFTSPNTTFSSATQPRPVVDGINEGLSMAEKTQEYMQTKSKKATMTKARRRAVVDMTTGKLVPHGTLLQPQQRPYQPFSYNLQQRYAPSAAQPMPFIQQKPLLFPITYQNGYQVAPSATLAAQRLNDQTQRPSHSESFSKSSPASKQAKLLHVHESSGQSEDNDEEDEDEDEEDEEADEDDDDDEEEEDEDGSDLDQDVAVDVVTPLSHMPSARSAKTRHAATKASTPASGTTRKVASESTDSGHRSRLRGSHRSRHAKTLETKSYAVSSESVKVLRRKRSRVGYHISQQQEPSAASAPASTAATSPPDSDNTSMASPPTTPKQTPKQRVLLHLTPTPMRTWLNPDTLPKVTITGDSDSNVLKQVDERCSLMWRPPPTQKQLQQLEDLLKDNLNVADTDSIETNAAAETQSHDSADGSVGPALTTLASLASVLGVSNSNAQNDTAAAAVAPSPRASAVWHLPEQVMEAFVASGYNVAECRAQLAQLDKARMDWRPTNAQGTDIDCWSPEEVKAFEHALYSYGKLFHRISRQVKTRSTSECIKFYYLWKKTQRGDGHKFKVSATSKPLPSQPLVSWKQVPSETMLDEMSTSAKTAEIEQTPLDVAAIEGGEGHRDGTASTCQLHTDADNGAARGVQQGSDDVDVDDAFSEDDGEDKASCSRDSARGICGDSTRQVGSEPLALLSFGQKRSITDDNSLHQQPTVLGTEGAAVAVDGQREVDIAPDGSVSLTKSLQRNIQNAQAINALSSDAASVTASDGQFSVLDALPMHTTRRRYRDVREHLGFKDAVVCVPGQGDDNVSDGRRGGDESQVMEPSKDRKGKKKPSRGMSEDLEQSAKLRSQTEGRKGIKLTLKIDLAQKTAAAGDGVSDGEVEQSSAPFLGRAKRKASAHKAVESSQALDGLEDHPKAPKHAKRSSKAHTKQQPLQQEQEDETIFNVEYIVKDRKTKRGPEYLVKWEGYSSRYNSWEPASNLVNNLALLRYQTKQAEQKSQAKASKRSKGKSAKK